jgi:hypothetical protein
MVNLQLCEQSQELIQSNSDKKESVISQSDLAMPTLKSSNVPLVPPQIVINLSPVTNKMTLNAIIKIANKL